MKKNLGPFYHPDISEKKSSNQDWVDTAMLCLMPMSASSLMILDRTTELAYSISYQPRFFYREADNKVRIDLQLSHKHRSEPPEIWLDAGAIGESIAQAIYSDTRIEEIDLIKQAIDRAIESFLSLLFIETQDLPLSRECIVNGIVVVNGSKVGTFDSMTVFSSRKTTSMSLESVLILLPIDSLQEVELKIYWAENVLTFPQAKWISSGSTCIRNDLSIQISYLVNLPFQLFKRTDKDPRWDPCVFCDETWIEIRKQFLDKNTVPRPNLMDNFDFL